MKEDKKRKGKENEDSDAKTKENKGKTSLRVILIRICVGRSM
jgi:hypothetical protein